MRVAIIGANGQLGSDLTATFGGSGWDILPLTHASISVEDFHSVRTTLVSWRPDVVINTAAFHVVPKCESDPMLAFSVNSQGALNIARVIEELGGLNVYFSTDYVFDGEKRSPYEETDMPNPLNVYGATKQLGETFTLNYSSRALVLRVSGIYGKVPCRAKGGNFVTNILKASRERDKLKVVDDEFLTPTPTSEIAEKTLTLVKEGATGLFHLTSEGGCSWFEFTKAIFHYLKIKTPVIPIKSVRAAGEVKRPRYSILENRNYNRLKPGEPMRHWKEALEDFLGEVHK